MTLTNGTPFATQAVPLLAPTGRDLVVLLCKATFVRHATTLVLADLQSPIRLADIPNHPDAPDSSVRYPSDATLDKPGSDIIVNGQAISARPVAAIDVAVRIGTHTAALRVHGERLYYRALSGVSIGPAAPFERKPIVYERAYGGSTPDKRLVDLRNPVGRGLAARTADLVDRPAPQVEHPGHPIASASDRPDPAGFGAIPPHWSPRRELAGTLDAAWQRTRMPLMPLDFDPAHNRVAHPSLQLPDRLAPGTPVAVRNMTPDGLWQFDLPALPVRLEARFDDGRTEVAHPEIDTLLIDTEPGRVEITARHAFRRGRGRTLLRELRLQMLG